MSLLFLFALIKTHSLAMDQHSSGTFQPEAGLFAPLGCQVTRMPNDQGCDAVMHKEAIIERTRLDQREAQVRLETQRREFKVRFNRLVDAVHNFARQYNEGKGLVWPQHEADKLREAMHQLQTLEKSLRDNPSERRGRNKGVSSDD